MHLIKTLRVAFTAAQLTLAGHTFAQQQDGTLYGQVVDNQGKSLPGVELQLRGPEPTGVRISNDNGKFRFVELRPGEYSVAAELEGFAPVIYDNIRISSARATEIRITMTRHRATFSDQTGKSSSDRVRKRPHIAPPDNSPASGARS